MHLGDVVLLADDMLAVIVGLTSDGRWVVRDEYNATRTVTTVYAVEPSWEPQYETEPIAL